MSVSVALVTIYVIYVGIIYRTPDMCKETSCWSRRWRDHNDSIYVPDKLTFIVCQGYRPRTQRHILEEEAPLNPGRFLESVKKCIQAQIKFCLQSRDYRRCQINPLNCLILRFVRIHTFDVHFLYILINKTIFSLNGSFSPPLNIFIKVFFIFFWKSSYVFSVFPLGASKCLHFRDICWRTDEALADLILQKNPCC